MGHRSEAIMNKAWTNLCGALSAAIVLLAMTHASAKEVFEVTLDNPSFTKGVDRHGIPLGWSRYGGAGKNQEVKVVDVPDGGKALLIADGDPTAEVGVL